MNKGAKKLAIGTVVAAAAGYIAGILTAPKSGKETRQDIKQAAEHGVAEAEKQLKRLHTELTGLLTEGKAKVAELKGAAREDFEKAMTTAKGVKEKARELLSVVHEGDTSDKDLKNAIDEANKAVKHLQSFLKKS